MCHTWQNFLVCTILIMFTPFPISIGRCFECSATAVFFCLQSLVSNFDFFNQTTLNYDFHINTFINVKQICKKKQPNLIQKIMN